MNLKVEKLLENGKEVSIETPYEDLNKEIGGWRAGELAIVGAQACQGKTKFALESAIKALRDGKSVLFYSVEHSEVETLIQMVDMLVSEGMTKSEASTFIANSNFNFVHDEKLSPNFIKRRAARESLTDEGVDFVIIDTLQIPSTSLESGETINYAIKFVNLKFAKMAKRMKIPVLLMTRINVDKEVTQVNKLISEDAGVVVSIQA